MPKDLILIIDDVHPLLARGLKEAGFRVETDRFSPPFELGLRYPDTRCLVLRSRLKIDESLMTAMPRLDCLVRVGSGLEGIDMEAARRHGIRVFNTPEGHRDAVGELAVGLLVDLMRHISLADREIRQGHWNRFAHTGSLIQGKTVALIGYGNTGKAFARKLSGFGAEVIFYDIVSGLGDRYARQTGMDEIFSRARVLSLHVPLTPQTRYLVNKEWVEKFRHPILLINTSRGEVVRTADLPALLESGRLAGAALDVLEYEKTAFGDEQWDLTKLPGDLRYLLRSPRVILTPHIAGLTRESYENLARVALHKILAFFGLKE